MQFDQHLTDQELVMAADGELPERARSHVESHLEACPSCRARAMKLDSAFADFLGLQSSPETRLPSAAGPRILLRAQLTELEARHSQTPFPISAAWWIATGIAAVMLLMAGLTILPRILRHEQELAGFVPDRSLTPGAVVSTSERNVCLASTNTARTIPAAMGQRVFAEYGIHSPRPRAYELDYLIAPELGGSDDIRNVWPQPYSAAVWNSHLKDALEGRLHDLVCSGHISLATAQHDIATNWVSAYKKYFQTGAPLPDHYAFAKDMPWGE